MVFLYTVAAEPRFCSISHMGDAGSIEMTDMAEELTCNSQHRMVHGVLEIAARYSGTREDSFVLSSVSHAPVLM